MLVVAIGGSASVGKTTLARELSLRLGIHRVVHVDDSRGPSFTATMDNVWTKPSPWLFDALITETEQLHGDLAATIDELLETEAPALIEGEGIEPRLLRRWPPAAVRAIYVIEDDADRLHETFAHRSSGARFLARSPNEQAAIVDMNRRYALWLRDQAEAYDQAWVPSQPWPTLAARALAAITAQT